MSQPDLIIEQLKAGIDGFVGYSITHHDVGENLMIAANEAIKALEGMRWRSVANGELPKNTRKEYGIPVLIHPPHNNISQVFYGGKRYGPNFYFAGGTVVGVTHWTPLPALPQETR